MVQEGDPATRRFGLRDEGTFATAISAAAPAACLVPGPATAAGGDRRECCRLCRELPVALTPVRRRRLAAARGGARAARPRPGAGAWRGQRAEAVPSGAGAPGDRPARQRRLPLAAPAA